MEVLGIDEDGDEAKTHLWRVPMSLPRKKKEISPKSSASITGKRAIMPTGILKRRNKSQKTSDSLRNLYANNYS